MGSSPLNLPKAEFHRTAPKAELFNRLKMQNKEKTKIKRYIVWSKKKIDLSDPFQKRWYLKQVLTYGRAEDVAKLDWNEIKSLLPKMELSQDVKALWEDYFNVKR